MEKIVLSRRELYDLVWSTPMLSLSKKYVISDNGLRKICKRMNIPLPPLGFWQKKAYGKRISIKKMPKDNPGENEISFNIRGENDDYKEHFLSTLARLEKEIENDPNLPLKVPLRLSKPDRLISTANECLTNEKLHFSHYAGMVNTRRGMLNIRVTQRNVSRALRFMDSIIKLLRARGHDISVGNHKTYAKVFGEEFEIYLREKYKATEIKDKWGFRHYDSTGELALIYGDIYKKEIKDGKDPLENKMAKVLAKLELEGLKEKAKRIEREKYWHEQEEKERIVRERKERIEKEKNDFKDLFNQAERWNQSLFLRSYIEKVEVSYSAKGENLPEEIKSWAEWAKQKADWYDPLVNMKDPFLTDEDKEHIIK